MKILIIEDDTNINNMLAKLLNNNGYETIQAYSGTEGLLLYNEDVDLILLDLMIPGKSGEEVIKELNGSEDAPIIVMSAISETSKKLELFRLGAKDYVTKPFDNDELLARIKVHLTERDKKMHVLSYKGIKLYVDDFKVVASDVEISLTRHEFLLLKALVLNVGSVLTKSRLFDLVWDFDSGDDNTLNVHISKLRNKLKPFIGDDAIETVWSIGYRLKK